MDRRDFVAKTGSALALLGAGRALGQEASVAAAPQGEDPFKVLFAPNPRHFGGGKTDESYLDGLKQAYDLGFRAWEDNGLGRRTPKLQEKIGEFLSSHGMTMGVSVVSNGKGARFFDHTAEEAEAVLQDCRRSVEVAKRVGHKWFTMIPGSRDEARPIDEQLTGSADLMKRCCDIFEPEGLIFVLEPLSHPSGGKAVLLRTFTDGHKLCKAVARPSCKILADYYHQQQMGGDLIKNTDDNWDEIAYVQYGDVPGRKQPATGEINFVNLTKHIRDKGFTGIYGLEHGVLGKLADLVSAYRKIDAAL